mgnify:CR=1 FL=1
MKTDSGNISPINSCKNCGASIEGEYCAHCGQRAKIHKVTFKETFQDFWDFAFSINGPFLVTLKFIFTNPGKLFREYLEGKRKRYYKPVAFFILLTVIHVLIRSIIGFNALENSRRSTQQIDKMTELYEAGQFMFENINNLLFFSVFSLALFLKLFFYKRASLAEFVAVSFYLTGVYIFLGTFNILYMEYISPGTQYLAILAMLGYMVFAMISWLKRPSVWIAIKAILAYTLGFIGYVVLAFGLSFLIVWLR